jgi:predicted CXXCH cytochrome family protein
MRWTLVATLFAATAAHATGSRSVVGSKHDLSVTGPGPIKAETETQVCIFCHVPHSASKTFGHLSSRPDVGTSHVPYASSTSRGGSTPTGSSRVCLSCHDGTIAVGETIRLRIKMNAAAPGGRLPPGARSNLGTDLRRTHPISIAQNATGLRGPSASLSIRLSPGGKVQCTSCHDAHSEFGGAPEGMFLLETTRDSQLCVNCHAIPAEASHQSSTRPFGAAQGNETGYRSVGEAGCMACHRSHGADARGWLLARSETDADDALCLRCHSGVASRADVARQMAKPYAHTMPPNGKHDPAEGPDQPTHRLPEVSGSAARHVACADCHDPHAATDRPAAAPNATGSLAGVWGIDQSGKRVAPAKREYEICFKCHGDSANKPYAGATANAPRRAAADDNLRRVFDPSSPSSHPVTGTGRSAAVPSLLPPWTVASQVYCSDCHASDDGPGAGGTGARGPHGSIYPYLLERNYTVGSRALEGPAAYALCYKCHDREVLLSDRSAFPAHRRHVVDDQTPCSVCHASHGVSGMRGTSSGNAHLIDFDLNVVTPLPGAFQPYTSSGIAAGSCSLSCHGTNHQNTTY